MAILIFHGTDIELIPTSNSMTQFLFFSFFRLIRFVERGAFVVARQRRRRRDAAGQDGAPEPGPPPPPPPAAAAAAATAAAATTKTTAPPPLQPTAEPLAPQRQRLSIAL